MFSDYKIIDNALSNDKFAILEEKIMSSRMPWFYSYNVADGTKKEEDMYFMHLYYLGMSDKPRIGPDGKPLPPERSHCYDDILPVLDLFTDMKNLLRAKSNLYGRTQELVHHDNHIDMVLPHKGGIFYVNSNKKLIELETDFNISYTDFEL